VWRTPTMKKNIKTYSELISYSSFDDRYNYLALHGQVGFDTFGFDRYMNQMFYKSKEWEQIRYEIISRDYGCDLGVKGREIPRGIIIHHINPITPDDIKFGSKFLLDPENLITVSPTTHNAIHYGNSSKLFNDPIERTKNDMAPWKR